MSEMMKKISFEEESPEIKDRVEKYWTKRADSFFDQRKEEIESKKAEIWTQIITEHIPEDKAVKILDVGCGAGFFTVILGRLGYNVTGIDLTGEMIRYANKMIEIYGLDPERVKALQMDAENPAFPDGTFDVIVTRNLTWTLPHPIDAYREWGRVLKKGGILLNFDAEYAKSHHDRRKMDNPAHENVSDELKDECHKIYHLLAISSLDRPEWDAEVLVSLGYKDLEIDRNCGSRIYGESDRFYIPEEMFMIKAVKK